MLPLLRARVEGGGGAASPPRGNWACECRIWTGWLECHPGGWEQIVEEMRRPADGTHTSARLRNLAGPSSASYSPWKLQETVGEGGVALSDPGLPLWGRGRWGTEESLGTKKGWRYNPRATESYLVLVIGAQAVPGLWVILSVPAARREEES